MYLAIIIFMFLTYLILLSPGSGQATFLYVPVFALVFVSLAIKQKYFGSGQEETEAATDGVGISEMAFYFVAALALGYGLFYILQVRELKRFFERRTSE